MSRTVSLVALAFMLVLSACAQGEDSLPEMSPDMYEFPAELVAAGQITATTTTTVPRLSAEPSAVEAPHPLAAVQALAGVGRPLPLPSSDLLPSVRSIEPSVVTPGGQRRLLRDVSVSVSYDLEAGLIVEPAGWWVINYPLERIVGTEGRTADEIATTLLGRSSEELTNYYFYTEPTGELAEEPSAAVGPAPIGVTRGPDLVVDNQHAVASDENDGSSTHPLMTIGEAVDRAAAGTVIHVYPGVYRESVVIDSDGTEEAPIVIQGIRGASGAMPVITGNDSFPANAWTPVEGLSGVYQAKAFTDFDNSLSLSGNELVARSAPWDLAPGEYVVANGSEASSSPRFNGDVSAREGSLNTFGSSQYIWEAKQADSGGFVDLGSDFDDEFAGGIFWGSAWVYIEQPRTVSAYDWYNTYKFDLQVSGPFRAGGISGAPLAEQPYDYRAWLDGELLNGRVFLEAGNDEADQAHPEIGLGEFGEAWHSVVMDEGWHHLVFQWDTTSAPGSERETPLFRFGIPEIAGDALTTATEPFNKRRGPDGTAQNYVSEYMVLGPVPATYQPTVYVRMPDDADPATAELDIAARSGPVVSILGDFVELHGFDIKGGAQAQDEALLTIGSRSADQTDGVFVHGVVVEGNYLSGSDFTGIDVPVSGDQGVAPITVRNNWVVDAGAVGIAADGSSERLTADTVNDWAPGRTQLVVEFNTIINAGWAGYSRVEDVSGIAFERMSGSTIRYNTIRGGGPGITLRGENYGIRVDGNLITDPWAWGIGVDGNPGPNLVANNVVTGLRLGPDWMKAHLLTWDSDQTWLINNTTDGKWDSNTGWYGDVGSWGAAGPENFDRIDLNTWELTVFRRTYINNLFLGSFLGGVEDYLGNWGERDTFDSNYREVPNPDPFDFLDDGAERANVAYAIPERQDGDYRLSASSDLNTLGAVNMTGKMASLDFYGLPRYVDESTSVGAFRFDPKVGAGMSVIEVLTTDGTLTRIEG
ncbi:MAG: hypothetical protein GY926_17010 [bacterium]|nr:hypothetical protein [bacterium]